MMRIPKSIEAVISEFEKLPGIGPKSAERLTYHLLRAPKEYSERLADTISDLKEKKGSSPKRTKDHPIAKKGVS